MSLTPERVAALEREHADHDERDLVQYGALNVRELRELIGAWRGYAASTGKHHDHIPERPSELRRQYMDLWRR